MNESRVVCVGVCVRLVVSWAHRTDLVAERRWHCLRPRRRMGYMDVILIPRSASGWRRRSKRFRSGQRTQQCGSFVLRPPYNDNSDTTTATTMMMMMGTERSVCARFVAVLEVGWASHTIWVFCSKQIIFIFYIYDGICAIRHTTHQRSRCCSDSNTYTHTYTTSNNRQHTMWIQEEEYMLWFVALANQKECNARALCRTPRARSSTYTDLHNYKLTIVDAIAEFSIKKNQCFFI